MPTTVHLMHITDIHVGQPAGSDFKSMVLPGFASDLRRVLDNIGSIDAVLVTGDIAFQGGSTEYSAFQNRWEMICAEVPALAGCPMLAVPGNHDLDRTRLIYDRQPTSELMGLRQDSAKRENLFRPNPGPERAKIDEAFAEFARWWKSRQPTNIAPAPTSLPGDWRWTLSKGSIQLGFLGLNTAWNDVGDAPTRRGCFLSFAQIEAALGVTPRQWMNDHSACFLLTHHPSTDFEDESRRALSQLHEQGLFAHLCGHLHAARYGAYSPGIGGNNPQRSWQASSLFGHSEWTDATGALQKERKYGYSILQVRSDSAGGTTLRVMPRLAHPIQGGGWRMSIDPTLPLEEDFGWTPRERLVVPNASPIRSTAPASRVTRPLSDIKDTWGSPNGSDWRQSLAPGPWREAAIRVVEECASAVLTEAATLAEDPWLDLDYPLRVVHFQGRFLPLSEPSPLETFLLTVAPFLRTAMFALTVAHIARAQADTSRGAAGRRTFTAYAEAERTHTWATQRGSLLAGTEGDALRWWLRHAAAARHPDLWSITPGDRASPAAPLFAATKRALQSLPRVVGITDSRGPLVRLVQAVGADFSSLGREDGLGNESPTLIGGIRLRPAVLGWCAVISGTAALDLLTCDEVVVDHIGRDPSWNPALLHDGFRGAQWDRDVDRAGIVARLSYDCCHPVVHFVLHELARRADIACGLLPDPLRRELLSSCTRIDALEVRPIEMAGAPDFALPHARFRLDHNRVRALLIGENIYGTPDVAFRELYQNALDACRFRSARAAFRGADWTASIHMVEGEEAGRRYVECRDNGVGMDLYVLREVFAVGGRRFHDTEEYTRERAEWEAHSPPIRHIPNSRFGIGVLSYFMVADELRVRTRRYQRDGSYGRCIEATISSASGLFRLAEREDDWPTAGSDTDHISNGGTSIRLWLRQDLPDTTTPLNLLKKRLVVAEYGLTHSAANGQTTEWPAGEPQLAGAPNTNVLPSVWLPSRAVASHDSQVWFYSQPAELPVLVDGMVVDPRTTSRWWLLNLRGNDVPALAASRNSFDSKWDDDVPRSAVAASIPDLSAWPLLPLRLIWALDERYPRVAVEVVRSRVALRKPVLIHFEEGDSIASELSILGSSHLHGLMPELPELLSNTNGVAKSIQRKPLLSSRRFDRGFLTSPGSIAHKTWRAAVVYRHSSADLHRGFSEERATAEDAGLADWMALSAGDAAVLGFTEAPFRGAGGKGLDLKVLRQRSLEPYFSALSAVPYKARAVLPRELLRHLSTRESREHNTVIARPLLHRSMLEERARGIVLEQVELDRLLRRLDFLGIRVLPFPALKYKTTSSPPPKFFLRYALRRSERPVTGPSLTTPLYLAEVFREALASPSSREEVLEHLNLDLQKEIEYDENPLQRWQQAAQRALSAKLGDEPALKSSSKKAASNLLRLAQAMMAAEDVAEYLHLDGLHIGHEPGTAPWHEFVHALRWYMPASTDAERQSLVDELREAGWLDGWFELFSPRTLI